MAMLLKWNLAIAKRKPLDRYYLSQFNGAIAESCIGGKVGAIISASIVWLRTGKKIGAVNNSGNLEITSLITVFVAEMTTSWSEAIARRLKN